MDRTIISTSDAPTAIGPYSQAVVSGGVVYTSGQIPLDPVSGVIVAGGIEAQTARVLDNLEAVFAAAGTSFAEALLVNVYLVSLDDFAVVNRLYAERIGTAPPPARVTVQVAALPREALVEISAIARVPGDAD